MPSKNYDAVFSRFLEHFQNELTENYKFGVKRYTEENLFTNKPIEPNDGLERTRRNLLTIMKDSSDKLDYEIQMKIALSKAYLKHLEKLGFEKPEEIIRTYQKLQGFYEELARSYGFVNRKKEAAVLKSAVHYQERLTLFQKTTENHRELAKIYKNLAEINEHENLSARKTTIDYLTKAADNLEQAAICEKNGNKQGELLSEAAHSYHELSILHYDKKNKSARIRSRTLFNSANVCIETAEKTKSTPMEKIKSKLQKIIKPKTAHQHIDTFFKEVKSSFSRRFKPFNILKFSPIFYHDLDFSRFIDGIIAFHRQANINANNNNYVNALKYFREALMRKFDRMPCDKLQKLHKRFACAQCHELMKTLDWAFNNIIDDKFSGVLFSRLSTLIEETKTYLEAEMSKRGLKHGKIVYPVSANERGSIDQTPPSARVLSIIQEKARAIQENRLVLLDPTKEEADKLMCRPAI